MGQCALGEHFYPIWANNGAPDIYKILGGAKMRQVDKDYSYMNNEKINENQEDLYVSNSGKLWNASLTRIYDEDLYVHISSDNATTNNMKTQSAYLRYLPDAGKRLRGSPTHCPTNADKVGFDYVDCWILDLNKNVADTW
ncbi:PREDICTED: uncharacterized protein LOC108769054, partial [Trachymyrmex cornetzi]